MLAWHGGPHINGGSTGAIGWGGHVGCKGWSGEHNSGLGLGASMGRWWGSRRGGGGCVRTSGGSWGVGCGAVARGGGLGWDWLASGSGSGSTSSYSSSILADLLHEIPHKVRGEGTWRGTQKQKIINFYYQHKMGLEREAYVFGPNLFIAFQ